MSIVFSARRVLSLLLLMRHLFLWGCFSSSLQQGPPAARWRGRLQWERVWIRGRASADTETAGIYLIWCMVGTTASVFVRLWVWQVQILTSTLPRPGCYWCHLFLKPLNWINYQRMWWRTALTLTWTVRVKRRLMMCRQVVARMKETYLQHLLTSRCWQMVIY